MSISDSDAAESAASTFGLPKRLGSMYDATAVAPGVHEDMKFDSFWKGSRTASGLDIIEDNEVS